MKLSVVLFLFFSAQFLHVEEALAFNNGEVKIMYPCSILRELELTKEERETITFFERGQNEIGNLGLIFRLRTNGVDSDFTVKYRSVKNEELKPDREIYRDLENSRRGEVKCEADVNYDRVSPKIVESCSFKSFGDFFISEHFEFMKMMDVKVPNFDGDLRDFREVSVKATSWKLDVDDKGPLSKKPSVERWVFGNECILEVSGKYAAPTKPRDALDFLKNLIKAQPSPIQGNKTGRVLGNKTDKY